jgi:hypothetical protein
MELPIYNVVIWLRVPSTPPNLMASIIDKAKIAPYESIELTGIRDIHWGFSNADTAIEFAENILEFAAMEDVIKLTVIGLSIGRKVYKDTSTRLASSDFHWETEAMTPNVNLADKGAVYRAVEEL